MKLSVLAPVFLILLSSLLEFANSDPRWSRGRFRIRFRHLIGGIRFRRRYHGCRPVGCTVSRWSSWNHCSQSCGGSGIQTRNRHIVRIQKCGGHCNYALLEKRFCNRFCLNGGRLMYNRNCRCKYGYSGRCCERGRRVNGRWSGWSKWSRCSKTCGYGGRKYRKRSCTNPRPSYGGRRCSGSSRQNRGCYVKRRCAVNGRWSGWSKWSRCSKTCGYGGRKYRKRSCTNPRPSYGGRRCSGSSRQNRGCYVKRCAVNGRWSGWSKWSRCSKTCGYGGRKYRKRSCTNPRPSYGGRRCSGSSKQSRGCYVKRCAVNGRWSGWSKWSRCSKTCGYGGRKYRTRSCTNPRPSYGGRRCSGSSKQSRVCYVKGCPVNGRWSGWSKWSRCSKTCGYGGRKYRKRSCTNPRPSYGGRRCSGSSKQSRGCYVKRCAVNGRWSGWSKWSRCSKTCGYGGRKYRTRSCTNPRPSYGGRRCSGSSRQSRGCYIKRSCKIRVNGGWSKWNSWTKCSKSCGSGVKIRRRYCTKPRPAYGGKRCVGKSRGITTCHLAECLDYSHRGCFTDSGSRAMPKLLKNLAQYYDAVKRCAKLSYSKKYKCFGVQNGGECWSGPNAHKTYNKYGHSQKCKNGKGGPYANDVYCYRGVPGAPVPMQAPNAGPKPTEADCWSDWAYSECTKPCGCGYKARTRYCKCGAGKYGSCKGLAMETFKCNCHQCGPPIDA